MSSIKRRDFLLASAALAACGRTEPMPIRLPYGPNPLDPRQPRTAPVDPRQVIKSRPYTQQSSASPVHLSSSILLSPGSHGTPAIAALKNPMGQDMELLEVKFELSSYYLGGISLGASVVADLAMGSIKLTNGAVPVWNFGRVENVIGERWADLLPAVTYYSTYTWRLPRPLFIPAGAVVAPMFTHTSLTANSINVRVGYSARTVFTKPKKIYVPWVASYSSKAFNPVNAADVDASTELDLVNPHPEPLRLQRFVGRTVKLDTNHLVLVPEVLPALEAQYLQMRLTDSYGRPLIRSYAPFNSAFNLTRSWELEESGAELDPEAYYIINLRKDLIPSPVSDTYGLGSAQAFVSMVGWRELENP